MDKGEQAYKLISVTDSNGNGKDDIEFYKDRIGSIAKNVKTCDRDNGTQIVKADFIQNAEGRLIQLGLRTSTIKEIGEDENKIHIHTRNSIYNFEKVELQEACYQDAANIIELYFTDQGDKFCKGYFYDEHSQPHVLVKYVHLGMFIDTVLIKVKDDASFSEYICRYYVNNMNLIEFYDTLYQQQPYVTEILIHNESTRPMSVRFPNGSLWEIPAGESKQGMP